MISQEAKLKRKPRAGVLAPLAVLLLALATAAAQAQIYDNLDPLKARRPYEVFGQTESFVDTEFMTDFVSGGWDKSHYSRKYEELLEKTLLPSRDVFADDPDYLNRLAAAYLWTGKNEEALRILKPLHEERPFAPGNPLAFDIAYNLATAYERMGLNQEALALAREAERVRGRQIGPIEQMRLERLEYKVRAETNPAWAKDNLSSIPFTVAWDKQRLPPLAFMDLKPEGGVGGAVKRHIWAIMHEPSFPDHWLGLAMLVEKRGEYTLAFELFQKAVDLGHPMSGEIKNHIRALEPLLPAGYTLSGKLWLAVERGGIALLVVVIALAIIRFTGASFKRAGDSVKAYWTGRRQRRWRPEQWQDHHVQSLTRELGTRLSEEEASTGAGRGPKNRRR